MQRCGQGDVNTVLMICYKKKLIEFDGAEDDVKTGMDDHVCVTGRIPPPSRNCTNIGKVHGYKSRGGEGCGVSENAANTVKGGRESFKPKINISTFSSPRSKKIIVVQKQLPILETNLKISRNNLQAGKVTKKKLQRENYLTDVTL